MSGAKVPKMARREDPHMAQKPQASTSLEKTSPEKTEVDATTNATTAGKSELTPERRAELSSDLVDRFALWSGVVGLVPLPVIDAVAVGGVQLQMLRRLSQIYDVPFSANRGKALLASLAGAAVPATSAFGAASALKILPIVGNVISVFVMPVLSAGATYGIGKAFVEHFKSGGTLLDFNPPDYREFIAAQKAKWNARRKDSPSKRSSDSAADTTTGATAASS
jgi:uncharacterized protein (DUF697 family)